MGDGDVEIKAIDEGDDHSAILFNALDDALYTLERTCDKTDMTIDIADTDGTIKIGALTLRVIDCSSTNEVFHHAVRDGYNL